MKPETYFDLTDFADESDLKEILAQHTDTQTDISITQTKRKHRLLPAAVAAAAAVVCMSIGAAAYNYYHKESVSKYIGITDEQLLAEYGYSTPPSFSNDKASLTIDVMFYDGYSAFAVITVEAFDPDYTFPHDAGFVPEIICDETGTQIERTYTDLSDRTYEGKYLSGYGAMSAWKDVDQPSNLCKYLIEFPNTEDWNGETLYMRFAEPDEPDYVFASKDTGRELLDGMMISFDFTPNCACETFTAENGEQILLSDFELIRPNTLSEDEQTAEQIGAASSYKLIYNDGTEEEVRSVIGHYNAEHSNFISERLAPNAPWDDAENAAVIHKVSEIAAVEIDGIRYVK